MTVTSVDVTTPSYAVTISSTQPGLLAPSSFNVNGRQYAVAVFSDDLTYALENLRFDKRVRGTHHLFRKAGVDERIHLQRDGGNAKPCRVKQVRALILK